MRAASSSIRRMACSSCSGSLAAPRRNSSAYPRIEVSGVRSSCDASAAKRRSCRSDAVRSANAASIWASMALRAVASRPTSVPSLACGTRLVRSPRAMASAVSSMSVSGCMPTRTSHRARRPTASRAATVTISSTTASLWTVSFRLSSDLPRTSVPRGSATMRARSGTSSPGTDKVSDLTEPGAACAARSAEAGTRGGGLSAVNSTSTEPFESLTPRYVPDARRPRTRGASENSGDRPSGPGGRAPPAAPAGVAERAGGAEPTVAEPEVAEPAGVAGNVVGEPAGAVPLVPERARSKGRRAAASSWSRPRSSWRRSTV